MKTKIDLKIQEILERIGSNEDKVSTRQYSEDVLYLTQIIEMQSAQIQMYTQHLSVTKELLLLMIKQDIMKEKQSVEVG